MRTWMVVLIDEWNGRWYHEPNTARNRQEAIAGAKAMVKYQCEYGSTPLPRIVRAHVSAWTIDNTSRPAKLIAGYFPKGVA